MLNCLLPQYLTTRYWDYLPSLPKFPLSSHPAIVLHLSATDPDKTMTGCIPAGADMASPTRPRISALTPHHSTSAGNSCPIGSGISATPAESLSQMSMACGYTDQGFAIGGVRSVHSELPVIRPDIVPVE